MNLNSFFGRELPVLLTAVCVFLFACVDEKKSPSGELAEVVEAEKGSNSQSGTSGIPQNAGIDNRVVQVVDYLKSEESPLYDPSSYAPIKWYKVTANEDSSQFIVNHEFRARDEEGVYKRYGKQFLLNKDGKVLTMQDPR